PGFWSGGGGEWRGRGNPAVRQVAVVRDREDLAARLLLPFGHPLPQIFRVFALERRVGQYRVGLVLAIAIDDVPMQVVAAAGVRGPLVRDEGGEATWLV